VAIFSSAFLIEPTKRFIPRCRVTVAAFLASTFAASVHADCPNSPDPSITCTRVNPPCSTAGIPDQIPGAPREGRELCSGNLLLHVSFNFNKAPGFGLSYNSQIANYRPDKPEETFRENEGFGPGWTGLPRIHEVRSNRELVVRGADGTRKTFLKQANSDRWFAQNRQNGDLAVIDRLPFPSRAYVLKGTDGSQHEFNSAIGNFIYLTEVRQPSGLATKITYQGAFPHKITAPDGSFIEFTCSINESRCTAITDQDNVRYTLGYANGLLSGYLDPAGRSTFITYTMAQNPIEIQVASITNSIGAKSFYAYYQDGVVRAIGDGQLNTTFTYRQNEIVSEFNTQNGVKSFSKHQFSSSPSGSYLSAVVSGDGDLRQNPGVLEYQIARLADGRPTSITNMFGQVTRFFYGESQGASHSACSSGLQQTSPIPTCVEGPTGEKTAFAFLAQNDGADPVFYQPKTITRFGVGGALISSTNLAWVRLGLPSLIRTTKGAETLAETVISYQSDGDISLPNEVRTNSTSQFAYDNQVLGRVVSAVSSSGNSARMSYDQFGRVLSESLNNVNTTYTYRQLPSGGNEVLIARHPFQSTHKTGDYSGLNAEGSVQLPASPNAATVTYKRLGTRTATSLSSVETAIIRRGSGTITYKSDSTAGGTSNGSTKGVTMSDFGAK
jgi:YD repeat-containing protein